MDKELIALPIDGEAPHVDGNASASKYVTIGSSSSAVNKGAKIVEWGGSVPYFEPRSAKRPLTLIAECGSLHNGDIEAAKRAATYAKEAGASYVKFIASNPDELIADKTLEYEGQLLYDVIDGYKLTDDEWRELVRHCNAIEQPWFVSIGTADYLPLMEELGCPIYKLGAWDVRNFPLIDAVAKTGKPIWIDVSCVIPGELDTLVERIKQINPEAEIVMLYESHGELNLRSIPYLKDRYGVTVGFSSEGRDSQGDIIAKNLGAEIIEKRLTPFEGSDGHHQSKALNYQEWKGWAAEIGESLWCQYWNFGNPPLGTYGLFPSLADVAGKQKWLTSLRFARNAKAGEIVTEDMLCARRPGNGLSPIYSYLFIGKPLACDVSENEALTYETCEAVVG